MSEAKKPKLSASAGVLLGMGNPLLDISVNADPEFLVKYELKPNDAILAGDKHEDMFKDMAEMEAEFTPGGATQNSIRVAQWVLGSESATTYFGCIGDDETGKTLTEKAKAEGLNAVYQIHAKEATGRCAVVVTDSGKSRSLVASLAAADHFTADHLDDEANWKLVQKAKFVYVAGFFLTVCPPAIMKVAKHVADNDKVMLMNLSAPFLCQVFKKPMLAALPFVDILFGNETEAVTFAKENDLDTEDVKEIAKKVAAMPKENSKRSRLVIFTQGPSPVIACRDGKITEYPVDELTKEELVDTNGAGDAFVGGFLSRLVLGAEVEECVEAGKRLAKLIISRPGCTFPKDLDAEELLR